MPKWIESGVQFAHTMAPLSADFPFESSDSESDRNAAPEDELLLKEKQFTYDSFISDEDPFPEDINFLSVKASLKDNPQKALAEFLKIRDSLSPDEALILEIEISYHWGQFGRTENLSSRFMDTYLESRFFPYAYYYYNKSLSLQQKFPTSQQEIFESAVIQLPLEYQADLFQMFAHTALAGGEVRKAIRLFFRRYEMQPDKTKASSEEILSVLSELGSLELLKSIEEEYSRFEFVSLELPYLRLKLYLEHSDYSPALELVKNLLSHSNVHSDSERFEKLSEIEKKLLIATQANPRRIGVILPLSSDIPQAVQLTQEVLEGLRLSVLALEEEDSSILKTSDSDEHEKLGPIELILRDSELDPEVSAQAVQELAEDEHVIAIIGPLVRKTSEAAAQEAQRLQVPLISLSLTSSIPDIGSYIFRNNQSWEQEMRALVRYAFDYKNARRFLILYPRTNQGNSKMSFFWDEVKRLGGTVVGGEGFELGQNTFIQQFEKFTGMDRYLPEDEKKIMNEFEEKLQPLHNFDALFIPVDRNSIDDLNVLLPYLAFYKMNDLVFLGDSGWNDYSVVSAIEKHVQDSVFVDSFFKQNSQTHVQRFVRLHERFFFTHLNYRGPSSYSAYSYDTLNLLVSLLSSPKNQSHLALQKALLNMDSYLGVTGIITFLVNGEAHREMKLLTVQSGKIISVN
ncbi:MAG: penicillin-binding protein activator [SAR324 cluster bacterium]|nr:penicillin-binding protein activator [SAR324 cluster bacterium]